MHRLLLTLLVTMALAGCLADDAPDDAATGEQEDAEPTAERIGVVLHTGPYEAAPGVPAEFDVEVPEGAVNVRFEIDTTAVPGTATATVGLSGCGSTGVNWANGGLVVSVGRSPAEGRLCDTAEAGSQLFSIEAGPAPLSGTVTLRADLPS